MLRPIHRLPPELLTRIFSLCVNASVAHIQSEGFRAAPPPTSLNPSKHPWALSQGHLSATFKQLRELELDSLDEGSGIHVVLLYLKVPLLKKLNIFSSGPDRIPLSTFLTHPQTLTSLSINRVEMSSIEFSAVLRSLSLLNDISFGVAEDGGISDDYMFLFRQTDPTTSRFRLVPNLKSLSFLPIGNFASTYTADALTDALEARWRATTEPDVSDSVATPSPRLLSVRLDKEVDDERLDQL
ncbi:hypothetical protein PM082_014547 [Marasmius tenuissimus]|nr:hypothetical protein PM082_014547 [Marasmius tenuissimus]